MDSFFRRFIPEDDHRLHAVRCGEPEEIGMRIRIEEEEEGGIGEIVGVDEEVGEGGGVGGVEDGGEEIAMR